MDTNNHLDSVQRLIGLRYIVGFLGERSQSNWWPTSFYDISSIQFLEPAFPRTFLVARYYGAVEAARQFHDQNLSVGSYHLFRLPEEIEQNLHEMVQTKSDVLFDPNLIEDKEAALRALSETPASDVFGPVLVGNIDDLYQVKLLNKVGAIYQHSMLSKTQAFPYLEP